ncbi:MAG: LLM class flavin-dependent oxidoreductase [Proteobacteria bacterium]|nr:LLM class flavin-dependent oxidoreductase [Burkholderiales bacterium]
MSLGVYFDGFSPTREMLEVARAAEEAGADSLWFAQHMGFREAIVWATAAVSVTRSIRLVPTAISPYLWPPLPVAMSMSTLAEYAGPRTSLAVSVGNLLNLAESGVEAVKPVRVMREDVQNLRALWAGAPVQAEGEVHRLHGAKMMFDHGSGCPLYVASTGPQVLRLAGEIGDGVLLSGALTLESCRRMLEPVDAGIAAAGRDPTSVRKAGFILFSIAEDGAVARQEMLRKLAFLFRSKGHAANIATAGLDIDHAAIMDCYARHDPEGALAHLPEAAATAFAVAGTPSQCRDQLAAYLAAGLDEPIIEVTGSSEQRRLALAVIREVCGGAAAGSRTAPGALPGTH